MIDIIIVSLIVFVAINVCWLIACLLDGDKHD